MPRYVDNPLFIAALNLPIIWLRFVDVLKKIGIRTLSSLARMYLLLMSCSMAANARDTSNRTDDPATSRKVSGAAS